MPAVKNETHPDPVAELERLLPHEGSLRNRVSDADAAELVAALLDAVDDDYNPDVCPVHPNHIPNRVWNCQGCRDDEEDDRYHDSAIRRDHARGRRHRADRMGIAEVPKAHHVDWQDALEARLS